MLEITTKLTKENCMIKLKKSEIDLKSRTEANDKNNAMTNTTALKRSKDFLRNSNSKKVIEAMINVSNRMNSSSTCRFFYFFLLKDLTN